MSDALKFIDGKPAFAISTGDMSHNKTGSWRYMRPFYDDKTPPCTAGCPAGEKIPQYFALVKEKKYTDAWHTILEDNPLPGVCGRVCYHPCEGVCNRLEFDEPIAINNMERFVADQNLQNSYPSHFSAEKNGKSVAILGSGPAGLSAAFQLARRGFAVTIYESASQAGGMLRLGIPKYRLPREILDKEIADIQSLGVEILLNTTVGKDVTIDELKNKFNFVLIATGAYKARPMGIPGEDLAGVAPGLDFLRKFNLTGNAEVKKRLVVIGGGNTAIDCARMGIRMNAEVTIVYRRTRKEMPAVPEEIHEAEAEGVKIVELATPVEYFGDGRLQKIRVQKMELGEPDESGRRRPVPIENSEYEIEADEVMLAIGEVPNLDFLPDTIEQKWNRIDVNTMQMTNEKSVFACGDAANGNNGTVVDAIATGKQAAFAIMNDERRIATDENIVPYSDIYLEYFSKENRPKEAKKSVEISKTNFEEVNDGISENDAIYESNRCFSCGVCTFCDTCLIYCPDVVITKNADGKGYEIDYDFCKGCGLCVEECPREAMGFEEELKWQK